MMRIGLAIVLAFAGCKSETARKASRAADELVEQRRDMAETVQKPEPERIQKEHVELTKAERDFAERKHIRIAALRGEYSVIRSQVHLISTMAEHFPLTDAGRANVNEKLSQFQLRLDEAQNHIEGLSGVDAEHWKARDEVVQDAMDKLDDARKAAWEALEDAPRTHQNAS